MQIREQFSKYAQTYNKYSKIQQIGAELLVDNLPKKIGTILDIGCGNGRIFNLLGSKNIEFIKFYGVDFSEMMIKLHPKSNNIELSIADFNSKDFAKLFVNKNIEMVVSSSALQWAKDIDVTFESISKIAPRGAFFIFTSNTFKSLHDIAKVKSPIHSKEKLLLAFNRYYKEQKIEHLKFKLEFDTTLEMLRYIKKSGISGGGFGLTYKAIKNIMQEYKLNYLEFEAMLLVGESRWKLQSIKSWF